MQEGKKDTRPDWCKEAEKHSNCFLLIPPDEGVVIHWGHKDSAVMNKFEFTGPCSIAVVTD